jgi:hypothetical protein
MALFVRRHIIKIVATLLFVAFLALLLRDPSMRNFVDLVIGVAWPSVVLITVLTFRSEIIDLLGRVKKFGREGAEFDLPQRPTPGDPSSPGPLLSPPSEVSKIASNQQGSPEDFILPLFRPLFRQVMQTMKDRFPQVKAKLPSISEPELLMAVAAEFAGALQLERASRNIFQSQLDAISAQQWKTTTKIAFKPFYERTAQTNPDAYKNYSFDQWFGFLVAMGLVAGPDDAVTVTPAGEAVRTYMEQQKYTAVPI